MLTLEEKQSLYTIIASVIGNNTSIKNRTTTFNETTVEVVENMIAQNQKCNENIKALVVELVGKSKLYTKGWLRKALKAIKKPLKKSDLEGYGCLVAVKSKWKTAIISSTL